MRDSSFDLKAPWTDHIKELRRRLLWIVTFFVFGFSISYSKSDSLLAWLSAPLLKNDETSPTHLLFLGLTDAFTGYLKIAFWGGIVVSLPILAFQVWNFISPGLKKEEKKVLKPFLYFSPILFLFGSLFAYYFVLPLAWSFFLSFQDKTLPLPLVFEANLNDYLSLTLSFLLSFGLCFEFPLVLIAFYRLNLLSSKTLIKSRKYAVIIIFIVAAILTPPDVLSQVFLALPLLVLYEGSIWYIFRLEKNNVDNPNIK